MTKLTITTSDKSEKKFKAVFTQPDGKTKTIHYGSSQHQDYTQHHDKKRRDLYRRRTTCSPTRSRDLLERPSRRSTHINSRLGCKCG